MMLLRSVKVRYSQTWRMTFELLGEIGKVRIFDLHAPHADAQVTALRHALGLGRTRMGQSCPPGSTRLPRKVRAGLPCVKSPCGRSFLRSPVRSGPEHRDGDGLPWSDDLRLILATAKCGVTEPMQTLCAAAAGASCRACSRKRQACRRRWPGCRAFRGSIGGAADFIGSSLSQQKVTLRQPPTNED